MTQFFVAMLQPGSPGDEAIKQAMARSLTDGGPFGEHGPFGWPGALIPIVSTTGGIALIALIGWLIFRGSQTRLQARAEFHRQLLDKFASGSEFAAFLNSSGGRRLLEDLWSRRVNAKERIIRSMQGGVVLTVLGLALAVTRRTLGPGVVVLALGAGLLISAAVSFRLSKKLGLLQERGDSPEMGSGQ
jgi:hypothetical protein